MARSLAPSGMHGRPLNESPWNYGSNRQSGSVPPAPRSKGPENLAWGRQFGQQYIGLPANQRPTSQPQQPAGSMFTNALLQGPAAGSYSTALPSQSQQPSPFAAALSQPITSSAPPPPTTPAAPNYIGRLRGDQPRGINAGQVYGSASPFAMYEDIAPPQTQAPAFDPFSGVQPEVRPPNPYSRGGALGYGGGSLNTLNQTGQSHPSIAFATSNPAEQNWQNYLRSLGIM